MAGIVFIKTKKLNVVSEFYKNLGAKIWIQQPGINILRHDNMIFGFHQQEDASKDILLTFFYPDKDSVDKKYSELKDIALDKPSENKKFNIYNFFAKDPEERLIEFQLFLHPIDFSWNKNSKV
jgi:hypothetical protein